MKYVQFLRWKSYPLDRDDKNSGTETKEFMMNVAQYFIMSVGDKDKFEGYISVGAGKRMQDYMNRLIREYQEVEKKWNHSKKES